MESQIKSHKSVHATVFDDDFVMMAFKLKSSNDEEEGANVDCLKKHEHSKSELYV